MNHKTTLRHLAKLGCITLFSLAIASCGGGGGGGGGSSSPPSSSGSNNWDKMVWNQNDWS